MELVQRRARSMPGEISTIQVFAWPSPEAEEALLSLPDKLRPKAMAGKIVARLPSGLVLPRCDREVMELVYEMERLAVSQRPSHLSTPSAESSVKDSVPSSNSSINAEKDESSAGGGDAPIASSDIGFDDTRASTCLESTNDVPRMREVQSVHIDDSARWQELRNAGQPVRVFGTQASDGRVQMLEFMSSLVRGAGREDFHCERQEGGQSPEFLRLQLRSLLMEGPAARGGSESALGDMETTAGYFLARSQRKLLEEPSLMASVGEQLPKAFLNDSDGHAPRWLVLSGGMATSSLRRNSSAVCAWSALLLGSVTWRLVPAVFESDPSGCNGNKELIESDMTAFEDSAKALPADVEVWEATQGAGEILLIPPGWWHQARYEGRRTLAIAQQQCVPLFADVKPAPEARQKKRGSQQNQQPPQVQTQRTAPLPQGSPGELSQDVHEAMEVLLGTAAAVPQGNSPGQWAQPSHLSDDGINRSSQLKDSDDWCAFYINLSRRPDRRSALLQCVASASPMLGRKLQRIDAVDGRSIALDDAVVREVVSEAAIERSRRAQAQGTHTIVHQAGQLLHFDDHLTPGGIGCAISHRTALRAIASHPSASWGLVLEDDVTGAAAAVEEKMAALLEMLPGDWDAVFLGYHDSASSLHIEPDGANGAAAMVPVLPLTAPLYGLYAWMVRKEAAAFLLDHVFPIDRQVDYAISRCLSQERQGRSFVVDPAHMLFFSPKSEVGNDSDIQTMATLESVIQECGSLGAYFSKIA